MRIVCKNSNLVFQDSGNIKRVVFENYDFDTSISRTKSQNLTTGKYMLKINTTQAGDASFYINASGESNKFFGTKLEGEMNIFFELEGEETIIIVSSNTSIKASLSLYEVRDIDYSDCYISGTTPESRMLFDKTKTYKLEVLFKYTYSTTFKIYGWENASGSNQIVKEVNAVDGDKLEYTFTNIEKLGLRSHLDKAHIMYKVTEIVK